MFSLKIALAILARIVFQETNYRSEMTPCNHHSRVIYTFSLQMLVEVECYHIKQMYIHCVCFLFKSKGMLLNT